LSFLQINIEVVPDTKLGIIKWQDIENKSKKTLHPTSGLASGGVLARGTLYRHFESSVPVLTFANPRPPSRRALAARRTAQWTIQREKLRQ